MKAAAERFQQILREMGLNNEVIEFSETTRTAADAATAIGTTTAQICKSILFEAGGEPVMVIASGANRIDTSKVQQHVGQPLHKANANFVREKTGYVIGGVPPTGHLHPFPIFIDQDLLQYEQVYAAAGTPNAIFAISPTDLQRITKGEVINCREE